MYQENQFKQYVIAYLLMIPCPLCGKRHFPRFFVFAKRTYIDINGRKITIRVVRIICSDAKKAGKKYTLTILPSFLFPYCRIQVDLVIKAAYSYLKGEVSSYQQATMLMHCESADSFSRYFNRIIKHLDRWIKYLAHALVKIMKKSSSALPKPSCLQPADQKNVKSITDTLLVHWNRFTAYLRDYIRLKERRALTAKDTLASCFRIIHPEFCFQQFGLGP